MIQHNDLFRYCRPDECRFDARQLEQIIYSADLYLAQRGFSGFFIIPLLYFITGYTSTFSRDYPTLFYGIGIVMVLASVCRVYVALRLKSPKTPARVLWQKCYFFSSLTTGLCWSLLAAFFLHYYGVSWEVVVVLYITAGIAGGSVSSYSNWLRLNQIYLLAIFGPLIVVSIIFSEENIMVVGVLSAISLVYNLGQVKIGNRVYWNSLINLYLLKNEVTAHTQSQIVLQQERDAFMTGPVMLFTWRHSEDWPVEHVSENVFEILGYTAREFIDGTVRYAEIVHPDDLQRVLGELEGSFEEPGNCYTHRPYRLIGRGGKVVWVLDSTMLVRNDDNEITHYNGYLIDVTTTVEMEEEIADTRKRLQAITENVPGVIFQYFVRNTGEIGVNYTSPKLFDIFGMEAVDDPFLQYQAFVKNIHRDDRKSWHDSVQESVEKQLPWKWMGRYVKESGECAWFEGQATVSSRKEEVIFDGILIDITGVKTLEEQKAKTEIQLHRAQKMEAIGMMAGGVAHDLNNILSGIVSYPDLLLLGLPEDSKLRKPVAAIRESGKRAATVVADLLTVARGAASVREPHDINNLIHEYLVSPECTALLSWHKGAKCRELLNAEKSVISCSPMHIKKTVMNLLTNAMEAVDGAGTVSIITANVEIGASMLPSSDMEPGRYVLLTVEDDGPGIPAENLEHIFEPFYTRKVMGRSGTGLGLAVVWNTVQDHNGTIVVESSEKGTRFSIYFPVSDQAQAVCHDDNSAVGISAGEGFILVVDDEALLRDIATEMLRALGYRVESVSSGEAAIVYVQEHPVDLLVIDMLMEPGINGCETYGEILKLYPGQKAVVTSGFSESDVVKETLRLGAGGFIKKPYSLSQLDRVVRQVLDEN